MAVLWRQAHDCDKQLDVVVQSCSCNCFGTVAAVCPELFYTTCLA